MSRRDFESLRNEVIINRKINAEAYGEQKKMKEK